LDYAGRVWEGRSLVYEGAHVVCQNERNIGIMLLGNFEAQSPSPAQRESVKRLIALLRERYKIKPHRVFGHCDLGHSVCPGRHLYAFVRGIRDQAQA
jgi:N-acetyl-anhydromuramyl-L-alanine amidase AmpD